MKIDTLLLGGTKLKIRSWLKKIAARLLPASVVAQLVNSRTLAVTYGQFGSIRRSECIDCANAKIPWYTYPAIEYLNNMDFSGKSVFEYGSGNSSAYWAKKAKSVHSVEHHREWYAKVTSGMAENQIVELCESEQEYLGAIQRTTEKFDVIIIDGIFREKCAKLVQGHLAIDGIVILDNADWYKETSKYLREEMDLLEVDFHGFGPINAYTWTTSIFFTRSARLRPINNTQPHYSLAAVENGNYEKFD